MGWNSPRAACPREDQLARRCTLTDSTTLPDRSRANSRPTKWNSHRALATNDHQAHDESRPPHLRRSNSYRNRFSRNRSASHLRNLRLML